MPTPGAPTEKQVHTEVNVEQLGASLTDTVPRLAFADAVVVLDAALRGSTSRPAVPAEYLNELAARSISSLRKQRYLRTLLSFASSLSESPGESLARVRCHELGFAPPTLQRTVRVDGRAYRVDFCWEEAGVVVEFDGWLKYRQKGSTFDAVRQQEKIREDAIRSTGLTVVRIYWEDLMEPGCRRLVSALTRVGVPRTGHTSPLRFS